MCCAEVSASQIERRQEREQGGVGVHVMYASVGRFYSRASP